MSLKFTSSKLKEITDFSANLPANPCALIPFGIFLLFYFGLSIYFRDFYKVSMPVAFIVASTASILLNRKISLKSKIDLYAHGMGHIDIMTMCLIFILAGAFAQTAKDMGAVQATVSIAMKFIPAKLLIIGIFLVSCFISISIGTSVGTIAAITPIALGIVSQAGLNGGLCLGAVIGGAMFGDNLSMISDTTIAATRTQNVGMDQKFKENIYIVIPAVIITLLLYLIFNKSGNPVLTAHVENISYVKVIPYLVVLILAVKGLNVMLLLILGAFVAGLIGMLTHAFTFSGFLNAMGAGALNMSETLIVALLSGGLLKVVRYNGGIEYLLQKIEKHIHTVRDGEIGIALLLGVVNIFTANNTVAIVITGPIAHEISEKYGIRGSRVASILDTTSCIVQGMLPYGAQVLVAIGFATKQNLGITAFDVLQYLWYPFALALIMVLSIFLGYPKNRADKAAKA